MAAPLVYGIDHFYIPLKNANEAFSVLTTELSLPPAWPFMKYGEFSSGGVNFGNANCEVIAARDAHEASRPARVRGLAFHPVPTLQLVAELDRRAIAHSGPVTFPPNLAIETGAMWTNTTLLGLTSPAMHVFACEYHLPGVYDYAARQASLDAARGGPLGLLGVKELRVTMAEPASVGLWQRFLEPIPQDGDGRRAFAHGPALRVNAGGVDCVEEVVLLVRSANAATGLVRRLSEALGGLSIRLAEPGNP
jgi:hypothetical protein